VPFNSVPVAINCCVAPSAIAGDAGVIARDVRVATVIVAVPDMLPDEAVMVVVPAAMAVARPEELLIVATAVSDELHVTDAVISLVELSE